MPRRHLLTASNHYRSTVHTLGVVKHTRPGFGVWAPVDVPLVLPEAEEEEEEEEASTGKRPKCRLQLFMATATTSQYL